MIYESQATRPSWADEQKSTSATSTTGGLLPSADNQAARFWWSYPQVGQVYQEQPNQPADENHSWSRLAKGAQRSWGSENPFDAD